MAGPSPNLKVNVGADTSGFTEGMKRSKAELQDFSKVSSSALDSFGAALGVDIGQIGKLAGSVKALGGQLSSVGMTGATSFKDMLPAINSVALAIAGLGIGAAVVAFKALNSEAEAFKNTVAGANIDMATAAYVSTYQQALHDMNTATGQNMANFMANLKKGWERFKSNAGLLTINFFKPDISYDQMGDAIRNANAAASESEQIASKIYRFQRLISDRMVEISEIDAKISDLRLIISDTTKSTAERSAAIASAQELIRSKYEGPNGLITLNTAIANLMEKQNSLTASSPEQIDAANQQRIKANSMVREMNQELRALSRTQGTITKQAETEAAARKAAKEAAAALAAGKKADAEWRAQAQVSGISGLPTSVTSNLAGPGLAPVQLAVSNWDGFFSDVDGGIFKRWPNGITIGVTWDYEDGLIDLTRAVNATLESLADTTGTIIGQLVGDLASGGDAWSNFADTALSAFGDLAISVGKMAIATGVATLGIKAALESLNGYVAIAAGVALVALGTAVKAGLSNIASGNYSSSMASAPIASSNYGSGGDYETREVNVSVTGTLQADGDQLVAVINSTNNKNYYTT